MHVLNTLINSGLGKAKKLLKTVNKNEIEQVSLRMLNLIKYSSYMFKKYLDTKANTKNTQNAKSFSNKRIYRKL